MFDFVLKNGKSIDDEPLEIAIQEGKIAKIATKMTEKGRKELDLKGEYISAGWIDSHVHCYEKMDLYYDYPDEVGIKSGVTTIVDAGTAGEENITDFYRLAKKAETNVYALLNISKNGIVTQDELSDLAKVNEEKNAKRIAELPDFILGIKARMSASVVGENGIEPLKLAKKLQARFTNLPLMVHIGSNPPELAEIFAVLESGDIVTHCYNGKPNGILNQQGVVKEFARKAYEKGILFDVGHGTESFDVNVAKIAKQEHLFPHTISTDIYVRNRTNGPVYCLAQTMDKMRYLGYTLKEVIQAVTERPAEMFHLENKGSLTVGKDADLTIFSIKQAPLTLRDSQGQQFEVKEYIQPSQCLVAGKVYKVVN